MAVTHDRTKLPALMQPISPMQHQAHWRGAAAVQASAHRTWCSSRSVGNQGPSRMEKKSGVRSSTSSCTWSGLQAGQVRAGHELATGGAGHESQAGAALCTQVSIGASTGCCPSLQAEQHGRNTTSSNMPRRQHTPARAHNRAACKTTHSLTSTRSCFLGRITSSRPCSTRYG